MIFVVVLSLAALAAAGPIQYDLQQQLQEVDDVNTLPYYYNQQYYPYGTYKNARHLPYYGQEKENYPFLPYNYKNMMSFPYRSNYHLRYLNKQEMSVETPKFDYDSKDIYHLHDVNHHHFVNNIHDVKQKQTLRKFGREMDSTYFPYSPMNQYMNMYDYYNRDYPYVNKYYGKSLDQEYIQPYTYYNGGYPYVNKNYGKSLDQEYIQPYNYYNRGYPYVNKYYGKSLDQEYIQPYNYYNRYWDMDYIKNYYTRNLDYVRPTFSKYDVEFTKPVSFENQYLTYVKPALSTKSLEVEYVKPIVSKNLDLEYIKPTLSQNTETKYIWPVVSKNLNTEYVKPVISKSLDVEYQQPIDFEFVPDRSSRNLDEEYNYGKWSQSNVDSNLWDVEQGVDDNIIGMNRFKRELEVPAGTHVATAQIATALNQETGDVEIVHQVAKGLKQEIPVTGNVEVGHHIAKGLNQEIPVTSNVELGHQIAKGLNQETPVTGTVEVNHQKPMIPHPDVLVAEQTPQEGLRQDVQLNAHQNVQTTLQAEDHISQQPIQRQKRGNYPYYYLYPYYIYVPIQPATIA